LPSSAFPNYSRIHTTQTADLAEGADLVVDITNMPEVPSNYYDILICSHVLEHVNDDKRALAELYRVLKPGGWGIIMVPIILTLAQIDEDPQVTDEAERWRRFGQFDHVRLYNKPGFVERVEAAGFALRQLGMDYFGESNFKRFGITGKSVLYVAEKRAATPKPHTKRNCDFFFIIGTGRCGTTLMAQILNAHSRICVPSEMQIAFETGQNGARLAEVFASQDNLRFRAADYIKLVNERCPHRLDAYYDYRTFFYELSYPVLSLQWLLTELYTDIAYSQGKSMFAEQTPWYAKNIRLLNELFPRAKFIHMVDGREAISFARHPGGIRYNVNLERGQRKHEIVQDGLRLVPQRILTVRYEDLVQTPDKVTEMVCSFLDVPFEPTMLHRERHVDYGQFSKQMGEELSSAAYQKWKREKNSAFFSDSVDGWKTNKNAHFDNFGDAVTQALQHFDYEV
jgi:hypothetical protein